ncbi:MAG: MaoC family dehydratase [Anaerolineae bacterium]|nr:MaoC family dehydratase [Anaerolineae bacterium]MCO5207160.1 MaoC family dehydratase [Anaerolineae bacterium]
MTAITIGQTASLSKTITDADVRTFAAISGDHNPVHLDDSYAANTQFGRRIAHGSLTSALISAVLGQQLPGYGTIYLSQSCQFKRPVYIGDTITASVEVIAYRADKRITTLKTEVHNQDGKVVITGEAVVIAPADSD